jgi:hypothetical protein
MPGAAVLDLASPMAGVNFDETTYFWPLLISTSCLCWLLTWLVYCMTIVFWKITAPVAGVLSYVCVRGGSILYRIQVWTGVVNGSSLVDHTNRTQYTEEELPRTQHYEITVEHTLYDAVKLILYGLYLVTVGALQGTIAVLTATLRSKFLLMSLTAVVALLAIS